jgi:glycosyltransferase involved in cell wall biosynthesis
MFPYRVIFCLRGGVGGVDVFSCNLIEELLNRGVDARIVLTTSARDFIPSNIPIDELPIQKKEPWPARWRRMVRYLEGQAPCIFIPNYEFNYSCISPSLSEKIIIVGIIHSDEDSYYADSLRLAKYWNGIVAVSHTIANHIVSLKESHDPRLVVIPYGVTVPDRVPERSYIPDRPLKIVYVGRLVQTQKRIFDLPEIFTRLNQQKIKIEITIIGDGGERKELLKKCENFLSNGQLKYLGALQNREVLAHLKTHDVILLTSEYEGLPICILEAMSQGCVPVVTAIRSGLPEVIQDGYNGFVVGVGDVSAFADRIALLHKNLALRKSMSSHAAQTIPEKYSVKRMADDYFHFFQSLIQEVNSGAFHRPKGKILIPPDLHLSWKQYLPTKVRLVGINSRRFFRRITMNTYNERFKQK